MATRKNQTILVKGNEISLISRNRSDYISLTDIARYKDAGSTDDIIIFKISVFFKQ